jgi:hypothetical protein
MSIIIKQTYCQNLRVKSAIVLVLFKLLFCSTEKFMNNIISLLDYYSVAHGKKSLKSFYALTIACGIARSPRSGILGSNLISDSYAAIFCNRKP